MKQCTFIFFLITTHLQSQWIQSSGPGGGIITAFAVSSSTLFAGTATGGVYRSTNNGDSWTFSSAGLTNMRITSLVVSNEKLFAGTSGSGVFYSTDNGTHWNANNKGLEFENVTSIAVFGTNIFVASQNGIFRSTDNGDNWVAVRSNTYINTLIVAGNYIFAGTNGYGLLRSTNNGNSWDIKLYNNNSSLGNVDILERLETNLFAKLNNKLFRSTDSGNSWNNINDSLPITAVVTSGKNLFATKDYGEILRSTDNGATWTVVSNDLYLKILKTITVFNNNLFIGTENYGVYRSTNNGGNWSAVNYGLANINSSNFIISKANLFVGTEHQGVFRSTNNGSNWIETNNSDFPKGYNSLNRWSGVIPVNCLAASEGNLFAATGGSGVYRSTNNGDNWTAVNNGLASYINVLLVSGTSIYAGGGGVYHSTNNGEQWILSDSSIRSLPISSLAVIGSKLFAGCAKQGVGVLFSTNYGASWDTIQRNLTPINFVTSLAVLDTNLFVGTFYGVYKLKNDTLVRMDGIPGIPIYSLAVSNKNIFVRNDRGVFLSTNNGTSWADKSDGLPKYTQGVITHSVLNTFAVYDENIFFGTASFGVWKRPLTEVITGIGKTNTNHPMEFILSQNYPNPFNPTTTIKYALHKSGIVKLIIYDALGRQIRTLVDETKTAGSYHVVFNAVNLSSGIYYFRLQSNEFVQTKKLILMK